MDCFANARNDVGLGCLKTEFELLHHPRKRMIQYAVALSTLSLTPVQYWIPRLRGV